MFLSKFHSKWKENLFRIVLLKLLILKLSMILKFVCHNSILVIMRSPSGYSALERKVAWRHSRVLALILRTPPSLSALQYQPIFNVILKEQISLASFSLSRYFQLKHGGYQVVNPTGPTWLRRFETRRSKTNTFKRQVLGKRHTFRACGLRQM